MIPMRSVKKGSKIGMKTRSMYVCSSLYGFQRVPLHVGSSSFIVSRPRDLRNCSAIFVTAPRSPGPQSLRFRARLLVMGFSFLRPINVLTKIGSNIFPPVSFDLIEKKRGGNHLTWVSPLGNRYRSDSI